MHADSKDLNWISKQVQNHPFNTSLIVIGIPQVICLYIIWYYKFENLPTSLLYFLFSFIIIGIYTSYAAFLRWRSKFWGIALIFWLLLISLIPIKWQSSLNSRETTGMLSAVQFMGMFWVLWFWLHAIFNKNILTWVVAVIILWFIILYTRKHK